MIAAPPTQAVATRPADIEQLAHTYAALDPAELDRLISRHVNVAVAEHRIDDAVRWQRIRLRARGIRARRLTDGSA